MNLNTVKNSVIFILCLIVCILAIKSCSDEKQLADKELIIATTHTEQISLRNRLGQEQTKVEIAVAENARTFLKLKTKEEEVQRLQALIKKYKAVQATTLNNSTKIVTSGANIVKTDTIFNNDTIILSPTYTFSDTTEWYEVSLSANRDTSDIIFKVYNKFDIVETKDGYLQVTNLNPYTDTESIRTVKIGKKQKPIKTFLKGVGVGAVLILTVLVLI